MTCLRTAAIVTGMAMAFTLVDIPLTYAQPEDTTISAVAVPAATAPEDSAVDGKPKAVAKRKKNRKKGAGKRTGEAKVKTAPGEKVTVSQVMGILKTTRDLSGKNLSGIQLIGVNLSKCNLKGADLNHANLERADLGESDLERADLTGANLKMANLRLSGMTGARLELAILDGAIWTDGRLCLTDSVGQCRELSASSFGK